MNVSNFLLTFPNHQGKILHKRNYQEARRLLAITHLILDIFTDLYIFTSEPQLLSFTLAFKAPSPVSLADTEFLPSSQGLHK